MKESPSDLADRRLMEALADEEKAKTDRRAAAYARKHKGAV